MSDAKNLKCFEFAHISDIGKVRTINNDWMDYFGCINGDVFLVCDGEDGPSCDNASSKLAIESIKAFLENHYFDMPEDAIKASVEFANSVIFKKSKENSEMEGIRTTLIMVIIRNEKIYYTHIGNSSIYFFSNHILYKLTHVHSSVEEQINNETSNSAESTYHPNKNFSTNSLGVEDVEVILPDSPVFPSNKDVLLLCTDGLTSMLRDHEIEAVLCEETPIEAQAEKLIRIANENGGTDNITLQLIKFTNVYNKKSRFIPVSEHGRPKIKNDNSPSKFDKIKTQKEKRTGTFFNKLNISPLWYKRLKFGAIVIVALILAYMFWDIFIRQGVTSKISLKPETTKDTIAKTKNDSFQQNKPQTSEEQKVKTGNDTIWLSYSVKKGEVLGKISNKFGIPLSFIKHKNKLKNDMIAENQKLLIPIKANHNVTQNETLDAIAKKYNISKTSILKANDIKEQIGVKAGKDLVIPFK